MTKLTFSQLQNAYYFMFSYKPLMPLLFLELILQTKYISNLTSNHINNQNKEFSKEKPCSKWNHDEY